MPPSRGRTSDIDAEAIARQRHGPRARVVRQVTLVEVEPAPGEPTYWDVQGPPDMCPAEATGWVLEMAEDIRRLVSRAG